jgi:hypothetical protein
MAFVKTQLKFGKVRFEVTEYTKVIQKQISWTPGGIHKMPYSLLIGKLAEHSSTQKAWLSKQMFLNCDEGNFVCIF